MFRTVFYLGLLVLLASCREIRQNQTQELNLGWQFSETATAQWHPARVPGSVQLDLLQNGLIPDPFLDANEDSIQWVERRNWTYRAKLEISEEWLNFDHLELVFEGLDTYTRVYLNDTLLFKTDNMFLAYRKDIRRYAHPGINELRLEFTSPVEAVKPLLSNLPYQLPSAEKTEIKVAPSVRKAAYQFGWDFAPRLVTMGIWRPVQLAGWNDLKVERVDYRPKNISDTMALYEAAVHIKASVGGNYTLQINQEEYQVKLKPGINVLSQEITVEDPVLWWPNGMGQPFLYDFITNIYQNDNLLASDTTAIGIRKINLLQEKDSIGTSFRFTVNDKPVFIKGANWSPLSSYPGAIQDSVYFNRLGQVKEANMNMLRVWGGGIYESDLFYELCDRYGILVWQDFMFANTMYAPDEKFYKQVEQEVRYQVGRLYNHPALALWNGNNEIEVAWENWGWQQQFGYSAKDSTELWQFYLSIFDQLIPDILAEYDPQINYSRTSPLSNWGTPENFNHGSIHYWGVWHGKDDLEDYRENVGRFVSEYGFQSFPSPKTFKPTVDFQSFSKANNQLLHQKSYVGSKLIAEQSQQYFGPSTTFEEFVTKSQWTQALAYKIAIESHRLADKCDGTLFWQLNDVWPGPSWSVIDYLGRPKIAYEVVKDRYKPTIIIPSLIEDEVEIFIVSEDKKIDQVELMLELIKYNGERVWLSSKSIDLENQRRQSAYRSHRSKILDGLKNTEACLKLTLLAGNEIQDIEYLYFTEPLNYLGIVDLVGQ